MRFTAAVFHHDTQAANKKFLSGKQKSIRGVLPRGRDDSSAFFDDPKEAHDFSKCRDSEKNVMFLMAFRSVNQWDFSAQDEDRQPVLDWICP